MLGRGSFYVWNADLFFKGIGTALFGNQNEQPATVRFQGAASATFNGTTDYGRALFPALTGQAFDPDVAASYGAGGGDFPAMVGAGDGAAYIPPEPQYGFGMFPALTGNGTLRTSSSGEGDATFPAFIAQGGEGPYGFGGADLPPLQGYGVDDFFPGQALLMHTVIALTGTRGFSDHIVFINNQGTIVDSISADRELIEQWIEQFEIADEYDVLGEFLVSALESLGASSHMTGNVRTTGTSNDRPAVSSDSRVWVVNIDTGATSQYDDYGFNSFFAESGKYYGVAEDGVYLLEGDTDNGNAIAAEIEAGLTDYGSKHKKRLLRVLVGVASGNRMMLKLVADGVTQYYEAHSNSPEHLDTHGFPTRRDHQGRYLNFTLLNQAGCDFDLESIEFHPIEVAKRY